MDFINNWQTALTDPLPSAAGVPLPVPPDQRARLEGDYLLTLTDGEAVEIIRYDAAAGAISERGLEGTQPQAWPVDTVIYAAVTAGQLADMQQQIGQLQSSITAINTTLGSLQQQIDDCCSGGGGGEGLTDQNGNTLTDQNGNTLEA